MAVALELSWPPFYAARHLLGHNMLAWAGVLGAAAAASSLVSLLGGARTAAGEMVSGVVLGPACLMLLPASHLEFELLSQVGTIGVCLLLFEAGMTVDVRPLAAHSIWIGAWAITAAAASGATGFVVLQYGLHMVMSDSVVGAISLVPAGSRVARSLLVLSAEAGGYKVERGGLVTAGAYILDFLALCALVVVERMHIGIPPSAAARKSTLRRYSAETSLRSEDSSAASGENSSAASGGPGGLDDFNSTSSNASLLEDFNSTSANASSAFLDDFNSTSSNASLLEDFYSMSANASSAFVGFSTTSASLFTTPTPAAPVGGNLGQKVLYVDAGWWPAGQALLITLALANLALLLRQVTLCIWGGKNPEDSHRWWMRRWTSKLSKQNPKKDALQPSVSDSQRMDIAIESKGESENEALETPTSERSGAKRLWFSARKSPSPGNTSSMRSWIVSGANFGRHTRVLRKHDRGTRPSGEARTAGRRGRWDLSDSDESEADERAEINPRAVNDKKWRLSSESESSESESDEEWKRRAASRRQPAGVSTGTAGMSAPDQSARVADAAEPQNQKLDFIPEQQNQKSDYTPEVVKRVERAVRKHLQSQSRLASLTPSGASLTPSGQLDNLQVAFEETEVDQKGKAGVKHEGHNGAGSRARRGVDTVQEAATETVDVMYGDARGVGREVQARRGDWTNPPLSGPMMLPSHCNATICQRLDEALLLYVMVASCLGLMILAEYLGSSYFLGALLCGLVFGVSGYVASVWSARTCNIISWASRIFFTCAIGSAVAKTPWLESQSVLGGVFVAAAAFAVRISCCLCLSATFLVSCGCQPVHSGLDVPNGHFTSSTNDLRQRAMTGLFLGLACSGRDEVAVLILLQLRAGDHLSAEGLAILLWSVFISSLLGPLIFSALLRFAPITRVDDENFSVGIVWVAQMTKSGGRSEGVNAPAETVKLVVAGFTPDSCARERGVALGDALVAFRSSDTGELTHVSWLLSGGNSGTSAQTKGSALETGRMGNILLVHKAMVGAHGSICELHLIRVDETGTSPSALPPSGVVVDETMSTSLNISPLSGMAFSRQAIDIPAVEVGVTDNVPGRGDEEHGWPRNDIERGSERNPRSDVERGAEWKHGGQGHDDLLRSVHKVKAAMSRLRDAIQQEDLASLRADGDRGAKSQVKSEARGGPVSSRATLVEPRGRMKVEVQGRRFGWHGKANEAGATIVASPTARSSRASLSRSISPDNSGLGRSTPGWRGADGEKDENAARVSSRSPKTRDSRRRGEHTGSGATPPLARSTRVSVEGMPERVVVVKVPRTCAGSPHMFVA